MLCPPRWLSALPLMAAGALAPNFAAAHGIVGNRFFPATIVTDDPAVADELTLPAINIVKTGDAPAADETDISAEWSKRLTSNFGVSFDGAWTQLKTPGGDLSGFQNLGTTFKYQALADAPHELMITVGLGVEWGGTGDARVGADGATTLKPTLYFGKGAGDLPEALGWARPLALTGVIAYAAPLKSGAARSLETGLALEYSLRYLASRVRDIGLPTLINQMTPLVEVQLSTPLGAAAGAPTTGTVNPGVIWSGRRLQLGAEAVIPINSASGRGVGAVFQVHWFVDDLFPGSLGKPIW
jgi:hypothetical protein